jgi:hypothetical protein
MQGPQITADKRIPPEHTEDAQMPGRQSIVFAVSLEVQSQQKQQQQQQLNPIMMQPSPS